MKTKILSILAPMAMIAILFTASCKKDRVASTSYAPLNDFYTKNQPTEQSFTVDSINPGEIIGKDGTHITNVPDNIFMTITDHKDIYYPYTIKLIEAYSLKNMILMQMQPIAQGTQLQSGGEFRVRAFKNTTELMLKQDRTFTCLSPATGTPIADMSVYYGFTKSTSDDWNKDVTKTDYIFTTDIVTLLTPTSNAYNMNIAKMGWINIGKATTTAKTSVSFTCTSTFSNKNYIDTYIVYPNLHSFQKVTALQSTDLLIGESITVISLAKDTDGNMYYFIQNSTVASGLTVTVAFKTATEAELIAAMGLL